MKLVKTALKVYGIATVGVLSFYGIGNIIDTVLDNPDISPMEAACIVAENAIISWKRLI